MQIRSAAKWIAAAAGILVGAVIVGFTLKDTTYIEAKLEQIKGARQSVTAVEKTTAKTQKIKNAEIVKDPELVSSMTGHVNGSRAFARYREIDEETKVNLVNLIN